MGSPASGRLEYPRVWMGAPSVWGDTSVSIRWYLPSFPSPPGAFWFFSFSSILPSSDPMLILPELAETLLSPNPLLFPTILCWLRCSFFPFMSLPEEAICFFMTSFPFSLVVFFFSALYLEKDEPKKFSLFPLVGLTAASQVSLR